MTRTPLLVGNWKMNGNQQSAAQLCADLLAGVDVMAKSSAMTKISAMAKIEVAICPPHLLLPRVADAIAAHSVHSTAGAIAISIGGQDLDVNAAGAFTGQTSADLLKDAGCTCVIVGHSERRQFYGDTDALVAEKTAVALAAGLMPLICVGETLQQRATNLTENVIAKQLQAVFDKIGVAALAGCVIAYEPVWAIGTGTVATPEQAQAVHAFIRQVIAEQGTAQSSSAEQSSAVARQCRILYGGSMKPDNAADLLSKADIDGGLIGGAALVAEDFLAICKAAA